MPSLRRAAEAATAEERVVILVGLANVTGKQDVMRNGTQAAQLQFWRLYHEILGHLPPEVLRRATMAFLRAPARQGGDKWFPDPGTLLEFARKDETYAADMKALRGLERLALAKPHDPGPLMTDEQWEEINAKRLGALLKRVDDAEKATAEEGRTSLSGDRWDEAGRKSLHDVERNRGMGWATF